MKTYDNSMALHFGELLIERMAQLRKQLQHEVDAAEAPDGRHVIDREEVADDEAEAVVDEAQAAQAAHELEQVLAARRRLNDRTYGRCVECGKAIDLLRLTALPATPYCTACQTIHEHERNRAAQSSH